MRNWFRRSKSAGRREQPAGEARRFKRLPPRVDPRRTKTGRANRPAPGSRGEWDAEQEFITRYGDPFD